MLLFRALYIVLNEDGMVVVYHLCDDETQCYTIPKGFALQMLPLGRCSLIVVAMIEN